MAKFIFISMSALVLFSSLIISGEDQAHKTLSQELSDLSFKHSSQEAGYSIYFPAKWEVTKGLMGTDVVALAPIVDPEDLFRENINIISAEFDFPITRQQYYEYNINSLNQLLTDFDLEKAEDVKIGDIEAKKIVFTHNLGVVNAKVMQFLILVEDRAYVITFTADPLDFDIYRPIFDRVGNSFALDHPKKLS